MPHARPNCPTAAHRQSGAQSLDAKILMMTSPARRLHYTYAQYVALVDSPYEVAVAVT